MIGRWKMTKYFFAYYPLAGKIQSPSYDKRPEIEPDEDSDRDDDDYCLNYWNKVDKNAIYHYDYYLNSNIII